MSVPTPSLSPEPTHGRFGLTSADRRFAWVLIALVLVGLAYRLAILFSPLGEIEGDEAIVGLMARHIAFLGDRPVFYYNQPYLGSLEAFTAAPLFLLFGSSTFLLKLVPTAYSLGFLVLTAITARKLFGTGPALLTGAYLALPPVMWAVWSTKARGGYAELVFLGAALLLATLWAAERRRAPWAILLWGLLAGLGIWNHLLAVVYVIPAGIYLLARRRLDWTPAELALGVIGTLLGASPLIVDNVLLGFPTVLALTKPPDLPLDPPAQFFRFFRVGIPVLLGLGQPTTSSMLFDADWLRRPAGFWPIGLLSVAILVLAAAVQFRAVGRLIRRVGIAPPSRDSIASVGPALLVLLACTVPPVVALTRFGFFVSEPRYALPLYSCVPLLAALLWRLPRPAMVVGALVILVINVGSLLTTNVYLWRSEESLESSLATREALVAHLVAEDRHQMYTDYWIGYPIMFETKEEVRAYVISGGFNRYVPHADNVQRTPNPAWVFIPGSEYEKEFLAQLRSLGGTATVKDVSVYRVYTDVQPLAAMRPPSS